MKTMLERGAGILMPVSSLPSPYGIGTFLFVTLTVSLDLLVVLKNLLRDHNEMKLEVILRIVYIKTGIDAHHI